ncbi:hypothetical protein FCH38_17075 [Agrobacterium tumefaciens]|nr:hypothetical protein [Agrobacterium tumefaciens]
MDINGFIATTATLEERGDLEKLDEIGLPPGNAIQWLFGLTTGFYFADGAPTSSEPTAFTETWVCSCATRHPSGG